MIHLDFKPIKCVFFEILDKYKYIIITHILWQALKLLKYIIYFTLTFSLYFTFGFHTSSFYFWLSLPVLKCANEHSYIYIYFQVKHHLIKWKLLVHYSCGVIIFYFSYVNFFNTIYDYIVLILVLSNFSLNMFSY